MSNPSDRVLGTPPTNTSKISRDRTPIPGRRAFLSGAAAAAIAASASLPAVALGLDPIFAAIDAHKAACANLSTQVSEHSRLESSLPREKRKSNVDVFEEKLVLTDDPRWIESEWAVMRSFDAETDAACLLVSVCPTTIASILALLRYANAADIDGEAWPRDLQSDDGKKVRSWHFFLIENVTAALTDLVSA
jgi:hypothetical protein